MYHHSLIRFATAGVVSLAAIAASADEGPVLQVGSANREGASIALSLSLLDAMPQHSFTTSTIWTDAAVTFSGVPLAAVLQKSPVTGKTVEMVALNDYAVSMPMAEIAPATPIVATRMDGKTLSVRDKGPFWVVYPYDSDPKFRTETVYARSVWQLFRLNIVD